MPQPDGQSAGHALAEDRDLGCQAESAGVRVLKGEPVALASAALEEVDVYVEDHRARQASEAMLEEDIPVLAMGPRYVEKLRRVFRDSFEAHILPRYANSGSCHEEVPDPYGSTMTAYRASARQLLTYVNLLFNRLQR